MEIEDFNTILLINLGGIGDILLSQPAVRALRSAYPNAKISMLISARAKELQHDFSFVDNWVTVDIEYGGRIARRNLWVLIRLLLRFRREKFDLAVNMRTLSSDSGSRNLKRLLRIISARNTAGRNTEGRGNYLKISIPETLDGQKHEMEYDVELAELLGSHVEDRTVTFDLQDQHIRFIQELLAKYDINDNVMLVGIHPGGMPTHRWPIERFIELIELIHKKHGCRIVLTGSVVEKELCSRIAAQVNVPVMSMAGKLPLRQLGALIKRCNLFISNDTGPMHIAAVLRTPLVALFGPGDIIRFDPRHIFPEAQVIYHRVDCAPCEKTACADGRCMDSISVDEVGEKIAQVFSR